MLLLHILIKQIHGDIQTKEFAGEYKNTAIQNLIYNYIKNSIPSISLQFEPVSFQAEFKRKITSYHYKDLGFNLLFLINIKLIHSPCLII